MYLLGVIPDLWKEQTIQLNKFICRLVQKGKVNALYTRSTALTTGAVEQLLQCQHRCRTDHLSSICSGAVCFWEENKTTRHKNLSRSFKSITSSLCLFLQLGPQAVEGFSLITFKSESSCSPSCCLWQAIAKLQNVWRLGDSPLFTRAGSTLCKIQVLASLPKKSHCCFPDKELDVLEQNP